MVLVTCSDDGGDCDTVVSSFDALRNGKKCPTCDSVFSHDARDALMTDGELSSVRIKCSDTGGDCETVIESFDELYNGKKCPICMSVLPMDTRLSLMD